MLRKSWTNLWPALAFEDKVTVNDGDNLLLLLQTIPGCEEAVATDTNKWMAADSESSENLITDDDIVAAVT